VLDAKESQSSWRRGKSQFETKLEAMKNLLPGYFNNYITGNEAADKLAEKGAKPPPPP
jgi:hypothetical protein